MELYVPVPDFLMKQKTRNPTPSSSEKEESSWSSTIKSKINVNLDSINPKRASASIQDMLDLVVSTNAKPKSDMERWALGTISKMVHQSAHKCVSNSTVLDHYDSGIGMVKDCHSVLKSSSELRASADFKKIQPQLAVNNLNIVNVQKKLLRVQ